MKRNDWNAWDHTWNTGNPTKRLPERWQIPAAEALCALVHLLNATVLNPIFNYAIHWEPHLFFVINGREYDLGCVCTWCDPQYRQAKLALREQRHG